MPNDIQAIRLSDVLHQQDRRAEQDRSILGYGLRA